MQTWIELLQTFGLPVVLVFAMGAFIWVIYKQSVTREDKLMGELAECRAVNEKAIETLAVYAERLGVIENDVKEIKEIVIKDE